MTCTLSDTNTTDILTTEYYPDEPRVLVAGKPEGSEVNSSKIGYKFCEGHQALTENALLYTLIWPAA